MKKTVFILGAGASKAYADSPSGIRMPIASDFFETFQKLSISSNPWVLLDGIMDYLQRIKHVDPMTYLESSVNIEDLHSEIEEALLNVIKNHDDLDRIFLFRSYNELTNLFACVVNEIQSGPVSKAHRRIAERLGSQDIVITFNWDTLMDRALNETGKWCPDYGYTFSPFAIFRDKWTPANPASSDFVSLLKLHGSSNWITAYPMFDGDKITLLHAVDVDTVWVFEYAQSAYDCYAGRYMPGYQPYSYGYYPPNLKAVRAKSASAGNQIFTFRMKFPWRPEGTAGDSGLVSIPLIIPPVREKRYNMYGALFERLWSQAGTALETADHITIIGYSFPKLI